VARLTGACNSNSLPTLILHGLADTTVDREQSVELDRTLTALGVEHELILIPGVGHTFDLQQWQRKPLPQDLRPVVVGFFDKHLKPLPDKNRDSKPEARTNPATASHAPSPVESPAPRSHGFTDSNRGGGR
jgi:dienelactone hydrolase